MPKDIPPDVRVIFDTQDSVVHFPVATSYWSEPRQLEGIDAFAEYLNTKAGKPRFTVISASALVLKGRGGMGRHYATYVKGEPQLRLRIALKSLPDSAFGLARVRGAWTVVHAMLTIQTIANDANVPFNDARQALWDYLRQQLGDVMERAIFPPANAVTQDTGEDSDDGEQPDPLAS